MIWFSPRQIDIYRFVEAIISTDIMSALNFYGVESVNKF